MLSLKVFLLQLILDTHIGYLGSFLLYWKFSPDTYYVSGAWGVMSVGILDNDGGVYYNSYGRESPYTDVAYNDGFAWHVNPSGGVYDYSLNVDISYGSPFTYDISYAYDVLPSGTIEGFNSYSVVYDHSYGNFIL